MQLQSSIRLQDATIQDPVPTKQSRDQTPATPSTEPDQEETGEYPGTINQGQLFSIIENGTMFDIIELNETTLENMRAKDTVATTTPDDALPPNDFYTTVIYQKEPPENAVEKSSSPTDKFDKKLVTPMFESDKKAMPKDSSLSKEVEMFPILTNALQKLNRTNRKELPPEVSEENGATSNPQHSTLDPEGEDASSMKTVLKKHSPKKYHNDENREKKNRFLKPIKLEINFGLEQLNSNLNVSNSNYSEIVPTEMNAVGSEGSNNGSESATTDLEELGGSSADVSGL